MKRLHAAAGIAATVLFLKIFAINTIENVIQQYIGAEYGITLETIGLAVIFTLIMWFVIKEGK